ncbi:MAG TPA: ABC transporter substrate-binding protein [Chloroflexota bacterium]|nr:ABC transporter substrate-binding protein [Chloroflexota bacterium]
MRASCRRLGPAFALLVLALAAGCASPSAAPAAKPGGAGAAGSAAQPAGASGPAAPQPAAATAVPPLSPPVKLSLGTIGLSGEIGMYLAQERGYFQDEGLDVEFVPFRSAAEALPALASGELALSAGAPDPSVFNAARRDVGVKLISSLSIVTPGDWGAALMVRQDHVDSGRYRDLSDLRGMNIAIHILGTTPQLYMDRILARGGLADDDVQFTIVQIPDQVGALANKAVDAAWAIDPFVTIIEGQGLGKKVMAVSDVFPGAVSMIILLSPVFERQQPEAVRRFAVAYLRGARDYIQAAKTDRGREEIVPVLTKYTGLKDPALYARISWPSLDPNGTLDPQVLDTMQDYFLQVGSQQEKQDVNRVVDPSYMRYAVERLGRVAP